VRKTRDEAESEYLTIQMKDVRIARVTQGSAEDNAETMSLLYAKVDFEYKPPKADGSLDVGEHFRFDVKNNTSW
jgi:type VI secretion system secreted protein Hcp